MSDIRLHESWLAPLRPEFDEPYMKALKTFLAQERAAGQRIFPRPTEWFRALDLTPLDQVRVVILGQDPYHGAGQAHGLCFSVQPGVSPPPSLQNIFKELKRDLNLDIPSHGYLQHWADQGVLMLNTSLTVEQGVAGSHAKMGWQRLTDRIIEVISEKRSDVVFLLWGAHAQSKAKLIDPTRHLLLKSVHPSPLSAHRGFIGNGHFSRANQFLKQRDLEPIDWKLPESV